MPVQFQPITAARFVTELESPYAFPGGYPRYFVCQDGEALSYAAAKENQSLILEAINSQDKNADWFVISCEINWEDQDLYCAHTGEKIPSAYGSDEDEDVSPAMQYSAGWNMPGYMPDMDPSEFETFDEAKRFIIHEMKAHEGEADTEEEAEALCHAAESVNLESDRFSVKVGSYVYWVTKI